MQKEKKSDIFKENLKDAITMRQITLTASFMALVFLSTALIYIIIPSAGGFFILGETFVYIAALVGGPVVGAIAGGVGAAMADMALGFGSFAPGTLVIKGAEAFAVGYIFRFSKKVSEETHDWIIGFLTTLIIGFSAIFSFVTIEGEFTIYIIDTRTIAFEFPGYFLLIIGSILSGIIWYAHLIMGERGKMAISCLFGGVIMVVGYYIYETVFLDMPHGGAASEIPFNIAQVVFGTAIAIPVVSYLRKVGILSSKEE